MPRSPVDQRPTTLGSLLLVLFSVSIVLLTGFDSSFPIGAFAVELTVAVTVLLLLGYGLAYFVHTFFPFGSTRGRILKWTFITVFGLLCVLWALQATAPHVFWDTRSTGGMLVRMDRNSLEFIEGFVEPTEHDRCFHGWTAGFRRFEMPPIFPIANLSALLLIPTFVESLNCRYKWRTPIKDRARVRKEKRRLREGRCHKCEYDMRGSPTTKCPECGADAMLIDLEFDPAEIRRNPQSASGRPHIHE